MQFSYNFNKKTKLDVSPRLRLLASRAVLSLLIAFVAAIGTYLIVRSAPMLIPSITAIKTDAFVGGDGDGKADPGETIEYTTVIQNSGTDGTGVTFNDIIDANTTLVGGSLSVSPIGANDTFPVTVVGNVSIDSANLASPFSVTDNDYLGLNPAATIVQVQSATTILSNTITTTTANSGNVVMTVSGANMGKFTYDPPAGFEGTDTFTYILEDNSNATSAASNRTATVSINVSGMIWFINNNAGACSSSCDGRLSHPYTSLGAFNTANGLSGGLNPDNNDNIFVYESATAYAGGVALRNGQKLIGQDATQSLYTITSLTPLTGSASLPAMNTSAPATVIQHSSDTVSVQTDVIPALIRGLSLDATAGNNAIDITISNATSGTLEISENIIVGAGAEGIDINRNGSGTLTLNVHNNTWSIAGTHGNAANEHGFDARTTATGVLNLNFYDNNAIASNASSSAVFVNGSGGGTITITGFANNSIHQNTTGTGITVNTATFDATPGSTFQQVSGGSTIIGTSGNGVGASGMVLTNVSGDLDFTDLDIFNDGGMGLNVDGTGAIAASTGFRLTSTGTVASVDSMSGPAVNILDTTLNLLFASIKSTNSGTTGVTLDNIDDGTSASVFSAGSGSSITNATGIDLVIANNNADVTYAGTISDSNGGQLVSVASNNGGTKSFTGAISNTGTSTGISLTNNPGTTIRFSGGLTLSTGSNTAFNATGGAAALEVCDENPCNPAATGLVVNTLTSTTGTALNVVSTTIGANNLEFRSISSNGATNGIVLNTTLSSGGLKVKGNGGSCTSAGTCSGGSIQNTTGDGISLTSTTGISLTRLFVGSTGNHGINTSGVNGLTLTSSYVTNAGNGDNEYGLNLVNPSGTVAIDGTTFNNAADNLVYATHTGPLTLNVSNSSSFSYPSSVSGTANSAILVEPSGSGAATVSIQNSTFTNIVSASAQIGSNTAGANGTHSFTFSNNTISVTLPSRGSGVVVSGQELTTTNITINNNNFSGAGGNGVISLDTNDTSIVRGTASNNTISSPPGIGIFVAVDEAGKSDVTLDSNTITNSGGDGIQTVNFGGTGVSTMDMTITDNLINGHSLNTAVSFVGGVSFTAFEDNACVVLRGNTVIGTPAGPTQCGGAPCVDYYLEEVGGVATMEEVPDTGSTTANAAYVNSSNDAGPVTIFGTIALTNGVTCNSTGLGMLPNNNMVLAQAQPETSSVVLARAPTTDLNSAGTLAVASASVNLSEQASEIDPDNTVVNASTNLGSGKPLLRTVQPVPAQSGETVSVPAFTLPAGKSVTIKFQVTVNGPSLPLGTTKITNQGTVSGSNFSNVLTTNGGPVDCETGSETCTPVDRPDANVNSINRLTPATTPTNATSVVWRVTFDTPISGLTSSNFTLANTGLTAPSITTVAAVTGAPDPQWDVTVNTGTGDGTLGLNMTNDTGLSHDVFVLPFTGETHTIDKTAPTVTSFTRHTPSGQFTNADSLRFQVTFSEQIMGFGTADFIIHDNTPLATTSATATSVLSGPFRVVISGGDLANFNGDVSLDFSPSMNITDLAGNAVANVEPATDQTYTVDNTAPTVTINQAVGQNDPTSANPIVFTAVFSEAVTDFDDLSDVTLGGTASATVTSITGGPTTYTVNVTATTNGTVTAAIPVNKAQDSAGNNNTASTSTDNTVTYDAAQPTVTINQAGTQSDPTGTSPVNFTVVFSESVGTSFVTGDVNLSASTAAGTLTGTVTEVAPNDGTTYNVAITGMTGDGFVVASINAGVATDSLNTNAASTSTDNSVLYDTVNPSVTINQAVTQSDPTNANPINFTAVFNEPVTDFDDLTDVTLTGTASATVTSITEVAPMNGTTYTVAVTASSQGIVIATIPSAVAQDLGGRDNTASSSTDNIVTYDATAPDVTINQASAQVDPTGTSPINFTVVFSELVTGFDNEADVTLSGTAGATTAIITEIAPNDGTTYTVVVSGMTNGGTVVANISAGGAQDLASNFNVSSTSTDNTVTFTVNTATTITSDNPDPSTVGQAVTVNFTVTASIGPNPNSGNVTVTDSGGATPCVGAVTAGAGSCNITLTTSGAHTLTATYAGSGTFNGSNDTESHSVSTTIVVNTFTDELNSNGNCSLREAVRAANTNAAVDACPAGSASIIDIITLATGTYNLTVGGTDNAAASGDLDITGDTRITGAGAASTIISGSNLPSPGDRIFHILSGMVQIESLTIKNGKNAVGAGVYNAGTLTLNSVTVSDNVATTGASGMSSGAGIYSTGTLTLNNSTVSNNLATSGYKGASLGAGIHNNGATVTLNSSTVTGNRAISGIQGTSRGGGIYTAGGSTTLNSTTPSGNTVTTGSGGIAQGPNTYP